MLYQCDHIGINQLMESIAMIIGVPKEIKNHEYRVGMVPGSVLELINHGHQVFVEHNAGAGIGFDDQEYIKVGAEILSTAAEVFLKADMIVKVKEPQAVERAMLREGQILFTYLHLAPDLAQTEDLIKSKAVCIAYETVTEISEVYHF
jgi:alanine dehydrogenase